MASEASRRTAFVSFPDAAYTHRAALRAVRTVLGSRGWTVTDGAPTSIGSSTEATKPADIAVSAVPPHQSLYLTDYDLLPFEDLLPGPLSASSGRAGPSQCSSYVIRKALIRKHYLASALHSYSVKQSSAAPSDRADGRYRRCTPQTWALEIQFADELEELLMDDLYDLHQALEANAALIEQGRDGEVQWFILKPGMADRGNGIRLFSTVEQLQEIFREFEPDSDDDDDDDEDGDDGGEEEDGQVGRRYAGKDTAVMTSQLRHFVIQEYLSHPLLLAPVHSADIGCLDGTVSKLDLHSNGYASRLSASSLPRGNGPRKFHLRAYVLATGSLSVYLHDAMLALFAPLPYASPTSESMTDLRPHLTNTCLQPDGTLATGNDGRPKEENVYLWQDLVGTPLSVPASGNARATLTEEMVDRVRRECVRVVGDTFEACAKAGSVHWQMWPNACEIFGIDLLVSHPSGGVDLDVKLLEINAQPDFAQTGARLSATIDRLFERTCEIAVLPFHGDRDAQEALQGWNVGESRHGTTLCFRQELSKAW